MFESVYFKKESEDLTIFIPGWGYDGRLFDEWKDRCLTSVLVCERFSPLSFVESLQQKLGTLSYKKLTLVGFSMGGFLAVDFAQCVPVDLLYLWGVRCAYPVEDLHSVRQTLGDNNQKILEKMQRFQCGISREDRLYLEKIRQDMRYPSKDILEEGLDYLETAVLSVDKIKPLKNVVFMHGSEDPMAPIEEVEMLSSQAQKDLDMRVGSRHLFRP